MLFDLRDVDYRTEDDRTKEDAGSVFRFFGITTADYQPKPAFETFRKLVDELGVR
jgi:hypothetical protein